MGFWVMNCGLLGAHDYRKQVQKIIDLFLVTDEKEKKDMQWVSVLKEANFLIFNS